MKKKLQYCQAKSENPICATEDCNCGQPMLLFHNWEGEELGYEELKEYYCKAANALSRYRDKHGFRPGALVTAQYRNDPQKRGVIAPFGDAWSKTNLGHFQVPVLLTSGVLQPWDMGDLTLISAK